MGRLYEFLKESGQLDDTLIVFTADNGLLNGEHGMIDKRTAHEPSIRVPLVVRYPGLTAAPTAHAPRAAFVARTVLSNKTRFLHIGPSPAGALLASYKLPADGFRALVVS